jgi:hypothetical protein
MTLKNTQELTNTGQPDVRRYIAQLQSLKIYIGAGAASNTNIPISGLLATATVVAALHLRGHDAGSGSAVKTDLMTDTITITAGNIKFTNTATNGTNEQVLVLYFNND